MLTFQGEETKIWCMQTQSLQGESQKKLSCTFKVTFANPWCIQKTIKYLRRKLLRKINNGCQRSIIFVKSLIGSEWNSQPMVRQQNCYIWFIAKWILDLGTYSIHTEDFWVEIWALLYHQIPCTWILDKVCPMWLQEEWMWHKQMLSQKTFCHV